MGEPVMGPRALRQRQREEAHLAALHPDQRARLAELQAEHARLGEERVRLHAAMFEAKRALADTEAAYRAVVEKRLNLQAEMTPLLPR